MGARREELERYGPTEETDRLTPDEEAALREQLTRVDEEKRRALLDPGPTWREWFLYSASKWYVGLGLVILDAWLVAFWLEEYSVPVGPRVLALLLSLLGALYADFLVVQVLWHRPTSRSTRGSGLFHRGWFRPVEYGRWTPEAADVLAGRTVRPAEGGPDPDEFL